MSEGRPKSALEHRWLTAGVLGFLMWGLLLGALHVHDLGPCPGHCHDHEEPQGPDRDDDDADCSVCLASQQLKSAPTLPDLELRRFGTSRALPIPAKNSRGQRSQVRCPAIRAPPPLH